MKRNVVLVVDADADTARAVEIAAASADVDPRFMRTSGEFFHFCNDDFENVGAIILDVDPGVHGMAILEAVDACENTPPVIVVSALEEAHLHAIVRRRGAVACLGKPISVSRLIRVLDEITARRVSTGRCDLWGHPVDCKWTRPQRSSLQQFTTAN
jgi:FixJ family two-component response regulator